MESHEIDRIAAAIDQATEQPARFPSKRLGPSKLGHDCPAYLWHYWHWTAKLSVGGDKARVIESSAADEARIINWFRAAGWEVRDRDKSGEQITVRRMNGHIVSKVDGIIRHPEFFNGEWLLLEIKAKSRKRFTPLLNVKSFQEKEPQEYAQVVYYLEALQLARALHVSYCRDDGRLFMQIIEADPEFVQDRERLAESAIKSAVPLARISNNPTYFKCKNCEFVQPCHYAAAPPRSCRSCAHCAPSYDEAGKMICHRWQSIIPDEFLEVGCDDYLRLI